MLKAYEVKILYSFPLSFSSNFIEIDPCKTGFSILIGLIPEKSRTGAKIKSISIKAKQNP